MRSIKETAEVVLARRGAENKTIRRKQESL
jgi:hypothetical protein